MIIFNNWQISGGGIIAQQFDNLTRRVEVVGDLPEEYEWTLLLECDGKFDTLYLARTDKGVGSDLTQDNLSLSGYYMLQLRGNLKEDTRIARHTNVMHAYVPRTLSGIGQWPEMPSEFAQIEQRIMELNSHPPIPAETGYWMIWNPDTDKYEESAFVISEESAALRAEAAAKEAAELVEQAEGIVNNAAWVDAEIDENGHLILYQSENFLGAEFSINESGHLEVAYT